MVFNTDVTANFWAVAPEIALAIIGLIVLGLDLYSRESQRRDVGYFAGFLLLALAAATVFVPTPDESLSEQLVLGGMLRHDQFTQIFRTMIYIAAALTCFIAMGDNRMRYKGEFYLLVIVATIGASLLAGASDLVMVFVALETLSISLYALAGFVRDDARSAESGLKYFLIGSFATGFTLYGFSLLYGFTGATQIYGPDGIGQQLAAGKLNDAPIIVAMMMIVVGFGFKISAVPFHFWTPDVYEGSPTAMTAFVSVASKAASFAVLLRFMLAVFPPEKLAVGATADYSELWVPLISVLAVITMTIGNVVALVQKNIKRLLAYSSIAQAGYALMGVAAIATTDGGQGAASVAFYMFMYILTNILAFGCIIVFANATGSETIADFASLGRRNLWLAMFMTVALLSLGGIPPAAGFIGKFYLFRAAVDADLILLAVAGVLNSIIALYYYLVIIKVMFVDPSPDEDKDIPMPANYAWVLGAASLAVVLLGTVLANPVIDWATQAGLELFI